MIPLIIGVPHYCGSPSRQLAGDLGWSELWLVPAVVAPSATFFLCPSHGTRPKKICVIGPKRYAIFHDDLCSMCRPLNRVPREIMPFVM